MASSITFCCSPAQTSSNSICSLNSFTSFTFFLLDPILHHSQNLVIYLVEIWAIRRPQHRSGEMNAGVSRCSSVIVSHALCTGTLSCDTKKSPDTCHMAGNNCWLRSTSRHLAFLYHVNFEGKSGCGTLLSAISICIKFSANIWNTGQVMAKNVIFSVAAAAILDFVGYEFWG